MIQRIVLSVVLGAFLAFAACEETNGGIGTSPSEPQAPTQTVEPTAPAVLAVGTEDVPSLCGVWVRATSQLADDASLVGEPPDVVTFTGEHVSCVDAVTIAAVRYPDRSFVRRVHAVVAYRAYEAE